ncbi:MAG TPA: helix-turn-helix transcriptional regulator [Candidatus Limnocylindrales bacterium]|jgi:transcriptional regulator with XRE-family HTH domain
MPPAARAALARMAVDAGQQLRDERIRRGWTLRDLARRAGTAVAVADRVESGDVATLESYARLAVALGLRPDLGFADPRSRRPTAAPGKETSDLVHAAMGELEARALARPGRTISIDEPYQHYQFAGRADVLAWDDANLLHIENRTRFPNLQDAAGAWNAKRRYLASAVAERAGIGPRGWRSVTHVMACLWSSEVLRTVRLHRASFGALCPDAPDAFVAWLRGDEPGPGSTSAFIVLDPAVRFGSRRRTIAAMAEPPMLEPRYRGYADAADALRRRGT